MTFGLQKHLDFVVCKDAHEAIAQGFVYQRPDYLPLEIMKAVVVQDGTEAGNPTVDLVLVDEKGQRYVLMITGRLLKALPLEIKDGL